MVILRQILPRSNSDIPRMSQDRIEQIWLSRDC